MRLKYSSNFWRTIEVSLINCKINLILSWSENCVIITSTDTKLYVPAVTSSTKEDAKLLQQLK